VGIISVRKPMGVDGDSSALKGHHVIAHGEALGIRSGKIIPSPVRAFHVGHSVHDALTGLTFIYPGLPRASPWAVTLRPAGPPDGTLLRVKGTTSLLLAPYHCEPRPLAVTAHCDQLPSPIGFAVDGSVQLNSLSRHHTHNRLVFPSLRVTRMSGAAHTKQGCCCDGE